MLFVTATRHDARHVRFQFYGPTTAIAVARRLLEMDTVSTWQDLPTPSLVVAVSPALLRAICACHAVTEVGGEPFLPWFIPSFREPPVHGEQHEEGAPSG